MNKYKYPDDFENPCIFLLCSDFEPTDHYYLDYFQSPKGKWFELTEAEEQV